MNIDFPLILVLATAITGLIWLIDKIFFAGKKNQKRPLIVEYARSFFPILLIVLLIRSFLVEPFRIPSGSLEPTLLVGDFILVNKYEYGLRLPVSNTKILHLGHPKRGDIVVFHWPPNPSVDYIKRVIGTPGDHISYINKVIYINGKPMPQQMLTKVINHDEAGNIWTVYKKQETLNGSKHEIFIRPDVPSNNFNNITVPPEHYFVMGDNRDDSLDSRFWGFVPDSNLLGKAILVWLSWDANNNSVRWQRIGTVIH